VRDALLAEPALRRAHRVAAYLAQGGELDLAPFLHEFHASGREVLLPRLAGSGGRMRFARHHPGLSLARNRYGIPEPSRDAPTVAPHFLEVVLLPLVAFDATGTRLGSGAGYFDRCFAFRSSRRVWHAPLLIGVAFACQEVPTLVRQPWDVPLDAVVTEHGLRRFSGAPR
jgi:5-formyltetrahydrofolate cyclo-ligase